MLMIQALFSLLNFPTLLVFTVTLAVALYFFHDDKRSLPPGPKPLPIVGNMFQLAGATKQWLMYMDWQKKYGPVMRVRIGSNTMVIVLTWDLIRHGLIDKDKLFADRPDWLYIINKVFRRQGIFWSNGATWRDLRKFSVVHLRDLGVGKRTLEERVQDEANILVEAIGKTAGSPLYPRQLFSYAVSNIICGIVLGHRFDYDDDRFQELYSYLEYFFKNLGLQVPENFFPFLRFLPLRSPAKPIIENDAKIREYFRKRIQEHRETFDPDNPRDFVDMYLKLEHENKNTETLSEENVFRVTVDLFLGGSETTATTILWSILYMVCYPAVQRRCHEEIDKVVGSGRQLSLADKSNLSFLVATIQEVQRRASTVPFAAPHAAAEDLKLGGYLIPKGTLVLFHLYSAHHDPQYWNQPNEFRPERWLDNGGKLRKREAFMPFSIGPRTCIGEPLAKMEIFLFLGTLLQNFTICLPEGAATPSLEAIQPGFVLHPKTFNVCFNRR